MPRRRHCTSGVGRYERRFYAHSTPSFATTLNNRADLLQAQVNFVTMIEEGSHDLVCSNQLEKCHANRFNATRQHLLHRASRKTLDFLIVEHTGTFAKRLCTCSSVGTVYSDWISNEYAQGLLQDRTLAFLSSMPSSNAAEHVWQVAVLLNTKYPTIIWKDV